MKHHLNGVSVEAFWLCWRVLWSAPHFRFGTDSLLRAVGIFPKLGERMSDGLFGLATAYRIVYGILGSYVIARLAPNRPMQHALIGGALGFVVSIIGAVATWNRDLGPHWYAIAIAVTALPCAWVGGKLRLMQVRGAEA